MSLPPSSSTLSHPRSIRTTLPSPTAGSPPIRTQTHHSLVELSTHVTDTADKLKHTLAHELCHLAAWALSGEMKPPHGAAFKLWCVRSSLSSSSRRRSSLPRSRR